MNGSEKKWQCGKCGAGLVTTKVAFEYMGRTFDHEVPACPVCKKVFVSKELAQGKMAEVETLMEDK